MRRNAEGKFESTGELMEYPGGEVMTSTYLTPDYSVGAANVQWHDGRQTDAFFVTFRRAATPKSLADISTIFCRYTANDDGPGRPQTDPRNPEGVSGANLLADLGRVRAVQKDGTVLAGDTVDFAGQKMGPLGKRTRLGADRFHFFLCRSSRFWFASANNSSALTFRSIIVRNASA